MCNEIYKGISLIFFSALKQRKTRKTKNILKNLRNINTVHLIEIKLSLRDLTIQASLCASTELHMRCETINDITEYLYCYRKDAY